MGNGGGSAADSTSTRQSPTSTSPVAMRRVDRLAGPGPHDAGDAHDELPPQVVGVVDDALDDAGAVPQVDEGQVLAVLPGAPRPSRRG